MVKNQRIFILGMLLAISVIDLWAMEENDGKQTVFEGIDAVLLARNSALKDASLDQLNQELKSANRWKHFWSAVTLASSGVSAWFCKRFGDEPSFLKAASALMCGLLAGHYFSKQRVAAHEAEEMQSRIYEKKCNAFGENYVTEITRLNPADGFDLLRMKTIQDEISREIEHIEGFYTAQDMIVLDGSGHFAKKLKQCKNVWNGDWNKAKECSLVVS